MSNKTLRTLTRYVHVFTGVSYPLLVYSPLADSHLFILFNQIFLLPAVVLSGLVMWPLPRVGTWLRRVA